MKITNHPSSFIKENFSSVNLKNKTSTSLPKTQNKKILPSNNYISDKKTLIKPVSPTYTWPSEEFPFREYFSDEKLTILIIECVIHNLSWIRQYKEKITNKHFFFVTITWHHEWILWKETNEIFKECNLNKNNFYFLCNSQKEFEIMLAYGFRGQIINNNAWLDENLYSILDIDKKYNALLIARRSDFKRHYLASKVENLALISKGHAYDQCHENLIIPPHVYDNESPLNTNQVVQKINESHVGLCLSSFEGACFASSEYLLCGIPVVSTKSVGGRDFWYDNYNSIICEDTEDSVAEAVNYFLKNKRDPEIIRSRHIEKASQQRSLFIQVLQKTFFDYDISLNASEYYKKHFINKLKKIYKPDYNKIFS